MEHNQQEYIKSVALPVGTVVGGVVIRKLVGAGSTAIIYEASDSTTQRVIVVKEYFPLALARRNLDASVSVKSEELLEEFNNGLNTFLQNGIKLSQIRHPNIVQLLTHEEQNNTVYRLIERIEGKLLSELFDTENFVPPEKKSEWMRKILDAINCIHEHKLLHLAIEPSNIIISDKGEPILIDFGNSYEHLRSNTIEQDNPYRAIELTSDNQGDISTYTDIYAASAVFTHLLTGSPPVPASARAKSGTDPRLALIDNKELIKYHSKGELAAIDRAISVSPQNRFADVDEWFRQTSSSKQKADAYKKKSMVGATAVVLAVAVFWLIMGRDMYVEYREWNALDLADPCATEGYLESYPEGRYSKQAREMKAQCQQLVIEKKRRQIDELVGPMVSIAEGCFLMGAPAQEQGRQAVERQHEVCVEDFSISAYEVSIEKFRHFIVETSFKTDAERNVDNPGCWALTPADEEPWGYKEWASWRQPYLGRDIPDDYPVSCVSAGDITAYLNWLNTKTGASFRLPTEAEWEYTARGKTGWARPWGNSAADACIYSNVADMTNDNTVTGVASGSPWPDYHDCKDGALFANSVGQYQPNHAGVYDLIGNVWEITCSSFSGSYGGLEEECGREGENRTDKGGGWDSGPSSARSAIRGELQYTDRGSNIGFRVVLDDAL